MRLTSHQISTVLTVSHRIAGTEAEVRLFGSRLDDSRRGGDLDLLIITPHRMSRLQRAELKESLEEALSMPVDILNYVQDSPPTPFQAIALAQAHSLDDAA
ncbi:nucleotidyltransferase family protein [Billgrantia gudaonensis]|uniref:Nucleotidyltransferase domain-containing protein n=1 Tax=Billgrantia gudaonensis TaxID=376427 RepID=A0A1G8Q748_9GAMM|nr:nucleotidyltransferase domain-containing protein [Halomonas gudaonensis]SDJ00413.1 Nucleotidyltransferase domain-containing protein [Halomonas gudaonensis]